MPMELAMDIALEEGDHLLMKRVDKKIRVQKESVLAPLVKTQDWVFLLWTRKMYNERNRIINIPILIGSAGAKSRANARIER